MVGADLGEGPLWDDQARALYWIDVRGPRLFRNDLQGKARRSWNLPDRIGFVALTEQPGTLLLGAVIEQAMREGRREIDFLRGAERYKYAWGAVDRMNAERILWQS